MKTSSIFAGIRPKYRYASFLYPSMESIVLTALYRKPSGAPPISRKIRGAVTPSEVFSATVSTAAFVTPSAVRFSVSLPTIMETAFLAPGRSFSFRRSYTFPLSLHRERAARIWKHQNASSANQSAGWTLYARISAASGTRNERAAIHTHRTPPAAISLRLSCPHRFRSRRSPSAIPFPMIRTG